MRWLSEPPTAVSAMPWSRVTQVHDAAIAAAHKAYDELGIKGWIMSHMSHSYHSGACLYFTFAFVMGDDPLGEYNVVKAAIQQAFIDNGGSLSHLEEMLGVQKPEGA